MSLTKYDAACRAVAEAHQIDEVKDIRDKAVALSAYAKQAKDSRLIAHATAIRKRAERRLGELMEDDRRAGKLAKGGGDKKSERQDQQRDTTQQQKQDSTGQQNSTPSGGQTTTEPAPSNQPPSNTTPTTPPSQTTPGAPTPQTETP